MIKALTFIHSVIFWFLVFFYTLVIHVVSYVRALFIKDAEGKELFYQRGSRLWGALILNTSLVKVKIRGLENIPKDTNVIYTPNHQSYLDIFILLKYLPSPYKFIIMRKLFNVPLIGYHIAKSGFVSLDRKDRKKSITTIHRIVEEVRKGKSFVVFPEGKLTADGTIGEFGRGSSIIIQYSRKPVVPIAINGSFSVLPKGEWKIKPREVTVDIGKPVYFEDYYEHINKETSLELGRRLRDIVVSLKG